MSSYIHFTEEQKKQARQTDLCDLLHRRGEKLKRSGREYEWRDGSQKVTIRGNLWFHQYERVGGDAIDFVRKYMNKSYPEAMEYLLGGSGMGTLTTAPPVVREQKPFELPLRNNNNRRAYAYLLNKRGIDREVLNAFFNAGLIYESADYHNAVFVGRNQEGVAVHAHKRGTGSESTFKGNVDSSDPRYSFHWTGRSNRVYLFEAPIDMLSFISLNKDGWRNHSYYDGNEKSRRVQEKLGFVYQRMTEGIEVKQLSEIRTGHSNLMTKERWQTVELFRRQKTLLDTFLEKNAITNAQYDKSLGDLREKMGMHGVN